MFKIATTETYDPTLCIDDWVERADEFDFLLYITKVLNSRVIDILTDESSPWAYMNKPSVLHLTVTGWGGSELEPNVPLYTNVFLKLQELLDRGFPKERVVLRIDPIIPTWKGCANFYYVAECGIAYGITRIRSSVMQLYKHSAERLKNTSYWNEISSIYKDNFWPDVNVDLKGMTFKERISSTVNTLKSDALKQYNISDLSFESCATKLLADCGFENRGCMSEKDLIINGLNPADLNIPQGNQRAACMCLMKHQLIPGGYRRGRCPHKCAYCYLKDVQKPVSTGDALY